MTRRLLGIITFGILILSLLAGCGGSSKWTEESSEEAWLKIKRIYEKERYLDAVDRLEIFLINHAGSSVSDSAQFLLAESHYQMKEYLIAASEYQKLSTQFPQSPMVEESEYMLGMSFSELSPKYSLAQEFTERTIEAFQLFIEDFPESDMVADATAKIGESRNKLARKEYENGRLYQKIKENEASLIYFESVLNNYYDTPFAALAQLEKANILLTQKKWDDAVVEYLHFLDKYAGHEDMDKASRGLEKAQANESEVVAEEVSP